MTTTVRPRAAPVVRYVLTHHQNNNIKTGNMNAAAAAAVAAARHQVNETFMYISDKTLLRGKMSFLFCMTSLFDQSMLCLIIDF